jgi:hypothetical protein
MRSISGELLESLGILWSDMVMFEVWPVLLDLPATLCGLQGHAFHVVQEEYFFPGKDR